MVTAEETTERYETVAKSLRRQGRTKAAKRAEKKAKEAKSKKKEEKELTEETKEKYETVEESLRKQGRTEAAERAGKISEEYEKYGFSPTTTKERAARIKQKAFEAEKEAIENIESIRESAKGTKWKIGGKVYTREEVLKKLEAQREKSAQARIRASSIYGDIRRIQMKTPEERGLTVRQANIPLEQKTPAGLTMTTSPLQPKATWQKIRAREKTAMGREFQRLQTGMLAGLTGVRKFERKAGISAGVKPPTKPWAGFGRKKSYPIATTMEMGRQISRSKIAEDFKRTQKIRESRETQLLIERGRRGPLGKLGLIGREVGKGVGRGVIEAPFVAISLPLAGAKLATSPIQTTQKAISGVKKRLIRNPMAFGGELAGTALVFYGAGKLISRGVGVKAKRPKTSEFKGYRSVDELGRGKRRWISDVYRGSLKGRRGKYDIFIDTKAIKRGNIVGGNTLAKLRQSGKPLQMSYSEWGGPLRGSVRYRPSYSIGPRGNLVKLISYDIKGTGKMSGTRYLIETTDDIYRMRGGFGQPFKTQFKYTRTGYIRPTEFGVLLRSPLRRVDWIRAYLKAQDIGKTKITYETLSPDVQLLKQPKGGVTVISQKTFPRGRWTRGVARDITFMRKEFRTSGYMSGSGFGPQRGLVGIGKYYKKPPSPPPPRSPISKTGLDVSKTIPESEIGAGKIKLGNLLLKQNLKTEGGLQGAIGAQRQMGLENIANQIQKIETGYLRSDIGAGFGGAGIGQRVVGTGKPTGVRRPIPTTGVGKISMPSRTTKGIGKFKVIPKLGTFQKVRARPKARAKSEVGLKQVPTSAIELKRKQITSPIEGTKIRPIQATTQKTTQQQMTGITMGFFQPTPKKPFIKPPPTPKIPLGGFRKRKAKRPSLKIKPFKTKYKPSLVGISLGKSILKPPKTVTGLGIRFPKKKRKGLKVSLGRLKL